MAAYKDEEGGTWYVSFYYEDWTGAKKRKVKRGFRTKKEALNFEAEYKSCLLYTSIPYTLPVAG